MRDTDVLPLLDYERADIGFIGSDTFEENRCKPNYLEIKFRQIAPPLGRLVLATSIEKAEEVTKKASAGASVSVATKYPVALAKLSAACGLCLRTVYSPHGSAEAMIGLGVGEAIYDISVSGQTLEDNGLIVIQSGEPVALGVVYKDRDMRIARQLRYNVEQV